MKKCIYCGKELPDEASFCPYCSRSQVEKEDAAPPKVLGRKWLTIIGLAILVIAAVLVLILRRQPKTYDDNDSALVVYTDENGTAYHVLLRSSASCLFRWREPQPLYAREVPSDQEALVMPLQLYIFDEATEKNASEAFLALVDSNEVKVDSTTDSRTAEASQPQPNAYFENAALVCEVIYNVNCQNNIVTWTLHMKNGDTLKLHETMQITQQPEAFFSYEDTPLETTEDLQALLDRVDQEISANTIVKITLAPVTYEGPIHLGTHVVSLIGTSEGDARTTIHGSVDLMEISKDKIMDGSIKNISFVGDGSGDGLLLYAPLFIESCSFSGYEYGVRGLDGSWPMPSDSLFEDCSYGLYIDSAESDSGNYWFDGLTFRRNGTGVSLIHMPTGADLYFTNCTYEDNDTDFDNQAGNKILDEY